MNLSEAHKLFVDHLRELDRTRSTLIAYGKDIEQLLNYLSKQGVNDVNDAELSHLQSFMQKLADDGYTAKSISRKTNSTKTFFKFLKSEGIVDKDVAANLKHPKVESKAPRILSRLEYRALRDAARDDPRTFAIIEVLLQTGITISELAGIKMEHINFDNGTLYIPARGSKGERTVPLNRAVIEALKQYIEEARPDKESDYLFITKTGNPLLVRNIRSTIDRYFKTAGVQNAKVNDLRHTFAAHNLENGTSLTYLSKVLGHKRVSTTERYLQFIEKSTQEERPEIGVL